MPINTAGQTRRTSVANDLPTYDEGVVIFDATAIVATDTAYVECGFQPRKIRLTNLTNLKSIEWTSSMAPNTWLYTLAAGTTTLDTTANLIVVRPRGFEVLQNATIGMVVASSTMLWEAFA
jgi:hypothetical protein